MSTVPVTVDTRQSSHVYFLHMAGCISKTSSRVYFLHAATCTRV
jgi:hypothetical protein